MNEVPLKGSIIGFEEYEDYVLQDPFGPASPFRLLKCLGCEVMFLVANPFAAVGDYDLEIQDETLGHLGATGESTEDLAVLAVVRVDGQSAFINLRSPLIVNTAKGLFRQIILTNETYPVSAPFPIETARG